MGEKWKRAHAPCIYDSVWFSKKCQLSVSEAKAADDAPRFAQRRREKRVISTKGQNSLSPFRGCICPLCTFAKSRERRTERARMFVRGQRRLKRERRRKEQKRAHSATRVRYRSRYIEWLHVGPMSIYSKWRSTAYRNASYSTRNDMPPAHQHLVLPLPFLDVARVPYQDRRT